MQDEVRRQEQMATYVPIDCPTDLNVTILPGKWVWDRKVNNEAKLLSSKLAWSSLAICRNLVSISTKHTLPWSVPLRHEPSWLCAACNLYVAVINFFAAFLNGKLPETTPLFIQLPTGMGDRDARGRVGLLRQGLYGLRQAARIWYFTAVAFLLEIGFEVSPYDAGLFIHRSRNIYMTLHVDNVVSCPLILSKSHG